MIARSYVRSQSNWYEFRFPRRVAVIAGLVLMILLVGTFLSLTHQQAQTLITSSSFRVVYVADRALQQTASPGKQIGSSVSIRSPGTVKASKALVRINQLDPAQYNSPQDYTTWAYSACSSAAMTVVINSYGHTYRIADVLKVEAGLHAITPDLGLLDPSGIDHTVAQFGFQTNWISNTSLDTVISVANQGHPVIVGFPPALWSGGHLLVVRGGNSQSIFLADSSRLNMQVMARTTFMKYWAGFAVVVTPNSPALSSNTSVLGKPTISANFINQVLATYHSPADGKGQALYNMGVKYGIDPAFALAFFLHESSMGTAGEAMKTLSLGNLRCYPGVTCVDQDRGGYAAYSSWDAGFQAWYELIRTHYVGQRGLTTVEAIIPVYAPTNDHNDEAAYIASVKHTIATWQAGTVQV